MGRVVWTLGWAPCTPTCGCQNWGFPHLWGMTSGEVRGRSRAPQGWAMTSSDDVSRVG